METRKPGHAQSDATTVRLVELDNLDTAPHADEPIPYCLTALTIVELGRAPRERILVSQFWGNVSRAVAARVERMVKP